MMRDVSNDMDLNILCKTFFIKVFESCQRAEGNKSSHSRESGPPKE